MKKRLFSLVLCLVMVFSLLPAFSLNASAAEPDANGITNPEPAKGADDQLNLTKSLAPGENGTYDLTLESWATGEVTTDTVTEKVPTDFVIVVDQSGSMNTQDMATGGYTPASNQYLESIANSSTPYYYKDGDQYYRVYAKRGYLYQYHAANTFSAIDVVNNSSMNFSWFDNSQENDATNPRGQIYIKDDSGQLRMLYISVRKPAGFVSVHFAMNLSYRDDANNSVPLLRPSNNRDIQTNTDWFDFNNNQLGVKTWGGRENYNFQWAFGRSVMINYDLYVRSMGYTELCYQDVEGVEHVINSTGNVGTAQYCDSNTNALTSETGQRMQYSGLYTASGMETRLDALKSALNSFASAVANEEDDFGAVDNRVSIVGFSSPGYSNTELLTHTERNVSGNNGWQKNTCDGNVSEYYGKGLVPVTQDNSAGTVNQKVTDAIGAITANGGTQPEDGLDMAYKVLDNRSEKEYEIRGGDNAGTTVPRNQVVIFFTDGRPGNNDAYDQYVEANEVVDKAKDIKQELGATIFSIGVFGESDGNPLTYPVSKSSGTVYDLGYVSDCEADDDYYLYRQWRANNAAEYGEKANDTIFSYMSVVSSNYPDAEGFITQAWINGNHSGTYLHATDDYRHKETAEATNKYYRMASNQQSLIDAFLQAATMNSESIHSDTAVPLDATAVFKDDVNLSDFDVSNATYTVKWQPVKMVGDELQNNGEAVTKVNAQPVPADGKIEYSGFDYSGNYVTSVKYGQKLVVVISGLAPKKASGTLLSNAGNAGVYGAGEDDPTVSIESPTLKLSAAAVSKTYVIDTNAKTTLATEANQLVAADNNANGVFDKTADNAVTYQLNAGVQNGTVDSNTKQYAATINSAYTTVDTALVYGKPYDLGAKKFAENAGWTKINTVPASSVYYDDSFTEENAQVLEHPGDVVDQTGTFDGSNSHIFTFYGTGIDVYCTTIDNGGYVSARVYQGNTTSGTAEGTVTVKNQSQGAYYNTPTVHFADLTPGYHTVWIYANGNANYQIDGVRIYNPVKATEDGETTEAAEELAKTDEANAHYFNLHDLLLNVNSEYDALSTEQYGKLTGEEAAAVSGILYLDNAGAICMQSNDENGDAQLIFKNQFELYEKNSPINEIYLQTTDGKAQGVAFKLANYPVTGEKVYLGVSAPKGSGTVVINGHDLPVTSSVDQYYDITEWIAKSGDTKGVVSIKTSTSDTNLISITNLKITRVTMEQVTGQNPPADAANNSNSLNSYRRLAFAPMTTATVEAIAEETVPELFAIDPETTEDPGTPVTPENPDTPDQPDDPKPVWNDGVNSVQTILKTLFQYLLNSLNSLFSGLGKW